MILAMTFATKAKIGVGAIAACLLADATIIPTDSWESMGTKGIMAAVIAYLLRELTLERAKGEKRDDKFFELHKTTNETMSRVADSLDKSNEFFDSVTKTSIGRIIYGDTSEAELRARLSKRDKD